ncbi:hypothetical protein [Nonomuraea recticatena]|uniref:Uncharacterized protein n=1 Tax=Nonomuraea recticatena TaxID=46178 RepID=A0ABN3TEB4_9ACTN
MPNVLHFNAQIVAMGIAMWDEMAASLQGSWAEAAAEIEAHIAAAPWGNGAEGVRFQEALMRNGGPPMMIRNGHHVVKQVVEVGPTMRDVISDTMAADQAEAHRIKDLFI